MRHHGFTLFECLLTLLILFILLSVGISYWRHFITEQQLNALTSRLINAIYLTGAEAIKRDEVVSLCGSADGKSCDGNWRIGMVIVIPRTATIIRRYPVESSGYRLIWRSSLGDNMSLNFTADGFTQGQQGAFYLCGPTNELSARRIVINRSGRLRVERAPVYPLCSS